MPNRFSIPYKIQVAASSRQSSDAVIIGGMSAGASATLSVTATGGTPTFTVNGGAEVTSASVNNGDSIVFYMDAPASNNSSNKMTITANGTTTLGYWRVWTGWDGVGSGIKRVFVGQSARNGGNQNGVTGVDTTCTSLASSAGLGGTWKGIISGLTEPEYAVNRIGYNWQRLQLVDGTDVVLAGNLWDTSTSPLLSPIYKDATGTTPSSASVVPTNTDVNGFAVDTSSNGTCLGFMTDSSSYNGIYSGSGLQATSLWIYTGSKNVVATGEYGNSCYASSTKPYLYCIEQ